MFRAILILHRYLGIAVGLIVLLWCLSAFVMMYVQYPSLSSEERLRGLAPLTKTRCCRTDALMPGRFSALESFSVEMLADRPTLFVELPGDDLIIVDLGTGNEIDSISGKTAIRQTQLFLQESGADGGPLTAVLLERDQWTVAGRFNAHRPLTHIRSADGTEVYVSSRDGRIVQVTEARERLWNWLGSVVHWTYPTVLRKDPAAWSVAVIALSGVATVMAVMGLYLGIMQLMRTAVNSPYRGITRWHHLSGLLFGILTATWLASGLLSMNPLGVLSGDGSVDPWRDQRIVTAAELSSFVTALESTALPADTVSLRSIFTGGELAVAATNKDAKTIRLNVQSLAPSPLADADWLRLGQEALADSQIESAAMLQIPDNYYFSHHETVALPVYRIVLHDADRTRLYFDADTGELVKTVDRDARLYRWAFGAFHRGDFHATLRTRPLWDIVLLVLLAGVTIGAATGVVLAIRRVGRR